MKDSEIIEKLHELALIRDVCANFQQELDELKDQAFLNCPDLNVRRHEILVEIEALAPRNLATAEMISRAILESGESVKGVELQAVFSKGRTTWDGQKLAGYAIAHPEIEKLKKVGKPSVAIREVKDTKKS